MYTVIEALTRNGRDLSLDYKISGLVVPRGSWDAKVLDAIAPAEDEIVLPKTSSSVFISTNIDYVLRNLGVKSLIVCTDRSVHRLDRSGCLRPRLPGDRADRCMRDAEQGAARLVAAQQSRVLQASYDKCTDCGDRRIA